MNSFDNESPATKEPELPRADGHPILRIPLEIDQAQPDRAKELATEKVTGFSESTLIAEIITPDDSISIIRTQFADHLVPSIVIVGQHQDAHLFLDPGESIDLSIIGQLGHCIVTLDNSGQHLSVYAEHPDPAYTVHTKMVEYYDAPTFEDNTDDPELPYAASHSE